MKYVLATSRRWHNQMAANLSRKTGCAFELITKKSELTFDSLEKMKPRYIFFPHWSYIVPSAISSRFECVIFHMTDLPFGRGGSPLQNLIARRIYQTKISALRCTNELDAGPIYLKEDLNLFGNAEEIFLRAGKIIEKMIEEIVVNEPRPVEQKGTATVFRRRTPQESNIGNLAKLEDLFDHIRMLDAEEYPSAYMDVKNFRLEFSRASLRHGEVLADVRITKNFSERAEEEQ